MAIVTVVRKYGRYTDYQGLAADGKPILTESHNGVWFTEMDTGNKFVWHINLWYPEGGGTGIPGTVNL